MIQKLKGEQPDFLRLLTNDSTKIRIQRKNGFPEMAAPDRFLIATYRQNYQFAQNYFINK